MDAHLGHAVARAAYGSKVSIAFLLKFESLIGGKCCNLYIATVRKKVASMRSIDTWGLDFHQSAEASIRLS
jgi:hypothetical protein